MAKTEENAPLIERILAVLILIAVAASVISFVAVLIASANGVAREGFTEGIWPFVTWVSYVGLPVGLVLVIVLLVLNMRRRARENRAQ